MGESRAGNFFDIAEVFVILGADRGVGWTNDGGRGEARPLNVVKGVSDPHPRSGEGA